MIKVLLVAAFASATLWGAIPETLTLAEAEKRALAQHPGIDAARLQALATATRIDQASATRHPLVTANFTAAGAGEDSRIAAGGLNNPVIYSRVATGVIVSQMLFDFGRTTKLIASSRAAAGAAEERAKVSRADILLAVRRTYYAALRTQTLLKVALATVEARQLIVDQVSELVKAQLRSSLDLSVVQTNLAEARLLLSGLTNEQKAAHAELAEAMGQQTADLFELAEEPLPLLEPLAISELRIRALKMRPELSAVRLDTDAARHQAAAEKALRYPAVAAVAGAGVVPTRVSSLQSDYAAVGLNVTLPFLNGGLFKARQAEAELTARALDRRLAEIENRIVRQVTTAWLDVNNATERLTLTQQLVDQARQSLELAQTRYDLGLSSIVELSQAQLTNTNAEIQHAAARYDLLQRRATLAYATGDLQ